MADTGKFTWLAILCWQKDLAISGNLEIICGDLKVAKLQLLDKLIGWHIIPTGCTQLYHFHPCVVMYVTWKIKNSRGISISNPIGHAKLIDMNGFVQSNLYHVASNTAWEHYLLLEIASLWFFPNEVTFHLLVYVVFFSSSGTFPHHSISSYVRSIKKSEDDIPVPPLLKSAALWGMPYFTV